jgi:Protein of unknown function (DUF2877)
VSAVRALLAAPAARRALVDGRVGALELALSAGAYVRLGRDWLMLTEPGAQFGPLSLAVLGLERLDLSPGSPACVTGSRMVLGEHAVLLERMRERGMAPLASVPAGGRCAMLTAAAAALAALPAPPAFLGRGIEALAVGRLRDAVHALAGLGEGLTPAGDDVLAGYAASRAALGALGAPEGVALNGSAPLSTLAAERSSALGLAYLRCAERGELPDAGAQLLVAIRRGSVEAVQAALPRLRAWGASSGMALAWGMAAAVRGSVPLDGERFASKTNGAALTRRAPARDTSALNPPARDRSDTDAASRIQAGDLRLQGRGDRGFRRAPRRLLGCAPI